MRETKRHWRLPGAGIGILDNMPGAQRPRTSNKLARIIELQEFDADQTQTQYLFGLGALARIDGFSYFKCYQRSGIKPR